MISMMSRLAATKPTCHSSIFRNRFCHAAALFALASTSSSPPLATSFTALATPSSFSHQQQQQQRHLPFSSLSVFGVIRQSTSSSNKSGIKNLSSTTSTSLSSSTTTSQTQEDSVTMLTDNDTTPASKLEALRSKMKELDLDCYIIPSDDPHLSGKFSNFD